MKSHKRITTAISILLTCLSIQWSPAQNEGKVIRQTHSLAFENLMFDEKGNLNFTKETKLGTPNPNLFEGGKVPKDFGRKLHFALVNIRDGGDMPLATFIIKKLKWRGDVPIVECVTGQLFTLSRVRDKENCKDQIEAFPVVEKADLERIQKASELATIATFEKNKSLSSCNLLMQIRLTNKLAALVAKNSDGSQESAINELKGYIVHPLPEHPLEKAAQDESARENLDKTLILELQKKLAAAGFDPKGIDGKWGPGTEAALKAYQAANKLPQTGCLEPGSETAKKLGITAKARAPQNQE